MSEVLKTFASLLFPFGFGAGVQLAPTKDGDAKVHGSASKWQTYLSLILWVVELGSLILAAVFALLLQADIKLIDDEAITGGDDVSKRLNDNLLLNSIAFVARAALVAFVVLVNLSSCTIPAVASTVSSYLFCGDIWKSGRSSSSGRKTCLMVWFVLEQLVFLLPMVTMVMLTLGNDIGTVLSKSCLQLGKDECGWDCALAYSPFTTFEETGHTFTRPVTGLYVISYLLYFIAAGVRLFRNTVLFLCTRTLVGNNATSHNSVGTDAKEVEEAIVSTLSGASKSREEITYSFNDGGARKRVSGRSDLLKMI
tara:strand:- start:567 stop:1496 length:930 start_codon:yes stop_codon:yes gene_type:complete